MVSCCSPALCCGSYCEALGPGLRFRGPRGTDFWLGQDRSLGPLTASLTDYPVHTPMVMASLALAAIWLVQRPIRKSACREKGFRLAVIRLGLPRDKNLAIPVRRPYPVKPEKIPFEGSSRAEDPKQCCFIRWAALRRRASGSPAGRGTRARACTEFPAPCYGRHRQEPLPSYRVVRAGRARSGAVLKRA